MSDTKEPTWPFAVEPERNSTGYCVTDFTLRVLGPRDMDRKEARRIRDDLARAYNLGWDGHAEGQQRAYVP